MNALAAFLGAGAGLAYDPVFLGIVLVVGFLAPRRRYWQLWLAILLTAVASHLLIWAIVDSQREALGMVHNTGPFDFLPHRIFATAILIHCCWAVRKMAGLAVSGRLP